MKVIPEMHTKFDIYGFFCFFFFIPKTFKSFCFPTFMTMSIPDEGFFLFSEMGHVH